MPTSLIADPDSPYAKLADRLRALGWQWRRESQRLPILPGEPEWVIWSAGEPPATLIYTFNPAVRLRVLAFSGADASVQLNRTAAFLPHLSGGEIAELLGSDDPENAVLGLLAAEELSLAALLPAMEALTESADDFVAEVAVRVAGNLLRNVAAAAREYLASRPRGADLLKEFAEYAGPAIRRQVVRTAGRDLKEGAEPALDFLLRAGLADPDWEVRASALLLAGRRGVRALADAAASAALPADGRYGLSQTDLRRLELLRSVVLGHLCGRPPEGAVGRHVLRCLLGENDGEFDGLYLMVHSLTVPLELDLPPERLPSAVAPGYAGLALARSGLPLSWVAPVPCWLGEAEDGSERPNPLRRVVPRSGYFVARRPLSRSQVDWILAGGPDEPPEAVREPGHPCSFAEALRLVEALSAIEGTTLVLPTADQWEIAARGPDGRRYPWGNGLEAEPEPERRLSPWGIEGMAGGLPQWTRSVEGGAVFCGGPALTCSIRTRPDGPGLVRPILVAA
jgi:hypothetical protein